MKKGEKIAVTLPLPVDVRDVIHSAWQILDDDFDVNRIARHGSIPHITLCAGTPDDPEALTLATAALAEDIEAFTASPRGIGIFVLPNPLIYLRWPPGGSMHAVFTRAERSLSSLWRFREPMTEPELWLPKTTIAGQDTSLEILSAMLTKIDHLEFPSTVKFDRFLLIDYGGEKEFPVAEFLFGVPIDDPTGQARTRP